MKKQERLYWVSTGIFAIVIAFAGFGLVIRIQPLHEAITKLDFPTYVMTIIGPALLLAAAVVVMPRVPLLKEWAYAGLAIDLLGATAAHAFAGDPLPSILAPAIVLSAGVVSYLTRPASRRLRESISLAKES